MKKINRTFLKPGRWVRVTWDDIGVQDGLIVECRDKDFMVYGLATDVCTRVEIDRIVQIGGTIDAKHTGLTNA